MLSNQRKAIICGLLLVLIAVLFTTTLPAQADRMSLVTGPTTNTYLPFITKPPIYLLGKVTYKGAPVAAQSLLLRFFDGSSFSTIDQVTTDANGDYQFSLAKTLLPGQSMYIRWDNADNNDAWLSVWACNYIEENPSSDIDCSFDIEDIKLHPTPSLIVLPYTFGWVRRSTPTDMYFFEMFDIYFDTPGYKSNSLGYGSSFYMDHFPSGIQAYTDYGWWVSVCNASGCGDSYYYSQVGIMPLK